MNSHTHFR